MKFDSLQELIRELISNGELSAEGVQILRDSMFDEEQMTKEKADFLFELKNKSNPEHVDPKFDDLFVDAITSFLIKDKDTPGAISKTEAKWLRGKLQSHWKRGHLDRLEKKMLDTLRAKSYNFPEILDYRIDPAFEFESLQELKREMVSDGAISENDVRVLRNRLFNDGHISREEADILFYIKNKCDPKRIDKSFSAMFVEAITSFVIDDEETPGEISEAEAKWLRGKLQPHWRHKKLDDTEKSLLENLHNSSVNFPEILDFRGEKKSVKFEKKLYANRKWALAASMGAIISAIGLIVIGFWNVIYTMLVYVSQVFWPKLPAKLPFLKVKDDNLLPIDKLFSGVVTSVDMFLFSLVLFIMGLGIYEMFVHKIDADTELSRPTWMRISTIDELKSQMGKVVLMVLIVTFLKRALEVPFTEAQDLMYLAIGTLLVAMALFLAHNFTKQIKNPKDKNKA